MKIINEHEVKVKYILAMNFKTKLAKFYIAVSYTFSVKRLKEQYIFQSNSNI